MQRDHCSGSLRAYGVKAATCATHNLPIVCPTPVAPLPLMESSTARAPCHRNIYLDMGANWCNTMTLYESLPEVAKEGLHNTHAPWHVFAVEAAPLIAPYVERCVAALAAGKQLPMPPVPPAGSSMQLLNYAPDLGCTADKVGRGRRERMNCVAKALDGPLARLSRSLDLKLTANQALLKARLEGARTRGGCLGRDVRSGNGGERSGGVPTTQGGTFEMIPAAAGASEGLLRMAGSPLQMLRGGSMIAGGNHMPQFDVQKVDVVQWILDSFTMDDFVVLKMDVEGAEKEIVPKVRLGCRPALCQAVLGHL
jgi:hypothetical protein